jgi:hypothetical protein
MESSSLISKLPHVFWYYLPIAQFYVVLVLSWAGFYRLSSQMEQHARLGEQDNQIRLFENAREIQARRHKEFRKLDRFCHQLFHTNRNASPGNRY